MCGAPIGVEVSEPPMLGASTTARNHGLSAFWNPPVTAGANGIAKATAVGLTGATGFAAGKLGHRRAHRLGAQRRFRQRRLGGVSQRIGAGGDRRTALATAKGGCASTGAASIKGSSSLLSILLFQTLRLSAGSAAATTIGGRQNSSLRQRDRPAPPAAAPRARSIPSLPPTGGVRLASAIAGRARLPSAAAPRRSAHPPQLQAWRQKGWPENCAWVWRHRRWR